MKSEKLKFGAHIFLWTERWSPSEIELIPKARALGLDMLEIAVGDDVEFNPSEIRKAASGNNIEIVISPGGVWPMEADLSLPSSVKSPFALDWHKRWIEKGAESGATAYTGALYSHPGHVDRRKITGEELRLAADNLRRLAEFAEKHNVRIVLEPMSHFRVSLANTPSQVMDLIGMAGHGNLFVLLDTYHLATEIRDYAMAVEILAPRLWGIHACENDRGVPGGGIVPWERLFKALKKHHFDGCFILETYNSSLRNGEFAFSRGMFHDVCPDGDEFVRQGMAFIKAAFKAI